jgi:hypothetical protein
MGLNMNFDDFFQGQTHLGGTYLQQTVARSALFDCKSEQAMARKFLNHLSQAH